jgi:hypothetical protein
MATSALFRTAQAMKQGTVNVTHLEGRRPIDQFRPLQAPVHDVRR